MSMNNITVILYEMVASEKRTAISETHYNSIQLRHCPIQGSAHSQPYIFEMGFSLCVTTFSIKNSITMFSAFRSVIIYP